MKLPDVMRRSAGMKIAALAFSLFLWFNIAGRREIEVVVSLPLRYTNMPTDMTFVDEVPVEAKAKVRGRGRFLKWQLDEVYFGIDLSAAGKGIVTHVVSPSEAVIPPDKDDVEVLEVVEPKAIRVELDDLSTRKIPVEPVMRGELDSDKVLIGAPRSDPADVVVAGAEKLVGSLKGVTTQPVAVNQLARREYVETDVDLSRWAFVECDPPRVRVSARIEDRKELGIPSVPIEPVADKSLKVKFTPDAIDIVISGATTQVDSLDPEDVRLLVDLGNLPKGQIVLTPAIEANTLHFEGRAVARDDGELQPFVVRARLDAPYRFQLVSVTPIDIGLVIR
jgi:YbbR domain-containing protein